jgi:hypothetical protein
LTINRITSWSSVAETLSTAVMQRGSLDGKLQEIAHAIATGLRTRPDSGGGNIVLRHRGALLSVRDLTALDQIFDGQSDDVKLAVWASFAVMFESQPSDEVVARLHDSASTGNLITALRLRFKGIDNQTAHEFAVNVFSPADADLVADWIGGASIFSSSEANT